MDRISKALQKMRPQEKKLFKALLARIKAGNLIGLDIKKLKGRNDIYRIRKGDIRIIFRKQNGNIKILVFEKRDSTTYNQYIFKI